MKAAERDNRVPREPVLHFEKAFNSEKYGSHWTSIECQKRFAN